MENKDNGTLIFETLRDKSTLKQDIYSNTELNFRILKLVLKEIADDLKEKIEKIDTRVLLEYKDKGEFEAHLQFGGDLLIFHMHTNVFKFDPNHSLWKSSYFNDNNNRGYCGVINIYNFLNDSFKYNRVNDLGYLIARIFINNENHYFVEGKRQLGFLYNDFINNVIDRDQMKAVVESAILYSLDFDLLVPPYDEVKVTSVQDIIQFSESLKLQTGKRLGFKFHADTDQVE